MIVSSHLHQCVFAVFPVRGSSRVPLRLEESFSRNACEETDGYNRYDIRDRQQNASDNELNSTRRPHPASKQDVGQRRDASNQKQNTGRSRPCERDFNMDPIAICANARRERSEHQKEPSRLRSNTPDSLDHQIQWRANRIQNGKHKRNHDAPSKNWRDGLCYSELPTDT